MLPADTAGQINNYIDVVSVCIILILAYILSVLNGSRTLRDSWAGSGVSSTTSASFVLRIFRRVVPPLGPLDLSPMVAVLVLVIAREFAVRLLTG